MEDNSFVMVFACKFKNEFTAFMLTHTEPKKMRVLVPKLTKKSPVFYQLQTGLRIRFRSKNKGLESIQDFLSAFIDQSITGLNNQLY